MITVEGSRNSLLQSHHGARNDHKPQCLVIYPALLELGVAEPRRLSPFPF